MKKENKGKGIRAALFLLRQELFSYKSLAVMLVMAVYLYSNMEPIRNFSRAVGVKVTPMSSIFLFSDFTCQTTILLGLLCLISNAPFEGKIYRYAVSRAGYRNWTLGVLGYLLCTTFLYVVMVVLFSNLPLLSVMDFHMEWGKIWATLARTNAGMQFELNFNIEDYVIGNYEGNSAFWISFLLEWLCMFWLALCTYFFNMTIRKGAGIAVSGLFIFLDTMIYNAWTPWAYRFSPVTLTNLVSFTKSRIYYGISFQYAAVFFTVTIAVFVFLIMFKMSKRKDTMDFE